MDEFVPLPTDEQPLSYEILMDEVHDVEFEPDSSSDEIDDSETVVEAESSDESGSEQLSVGQEDEPRLGEGCIQCNETTDSFVRYCDECFVNRRSWLPKKPTSPSDNDHVNHREECPATQGERRSRDPVPEAPVQDASVGECTPNEQGQKQALPQAVNTKDLPLATVDIQSMQPGTSGTQVCEQQLSQSPRWPPGWSPVSDRPSKGGTTIKDKDFIAVQDRLCTLCCLEPKNACLIHGSISHQVCCYKCAKKLFRKKDSRCPVCRRKVERITRNIIP